MSVRAFRFVVCTYNLWNDKQWSDRKNPLQQFITLHQPDILCLQELCLQSRNLLDQTLENHQRVDDPFEGWEKQGNIYWNKSLFNLVEYGIEEIGILEQWRRLFWVRLQANATGTPTLLIATAHYTWPGNSKERTDRINVRVEQALNTIKALNQLAKPTIPLLFMGDFNDHYLPLQVLQAAGLTNCFTALGQHPQITRPATPDAIHPPEVVDWILHRGAIQPMNCSAVDFFLGSTTPSDHKPLLATYRLT